MEEALKYFDDQVILFKELYEANPRSESLKNGLAISYERLGDIHQSMGHMEEALKYFDDEVILFKELYEANPRSESLKNGLAISFEKLGGLYLSLNNDSAAKQNFKLFEKLAAGLLKSNPASINNQSNYAEVAAISAILELQVQSHNQTALIALRDSVQSWHKLYNQTGNEYYAKKMTLVEQYQKGLNNYRDTIIKLTRE
jgi:tetratricopeptide (TPR) repeat protein